MPADVSAAAVALSRQRSCQDVCWSADDILFGSGISPLPTTTPESFATRIGYVLLAVGYTLCMMALLWPRERSVSTQLSLRSSGHAATGPTRSPAAPPPPRAPVDRQVCRRHAVPPLATRPCRCSASTAMPERRQLPAYRALGALAARGSALLSEGLSISLPKRLDGRSARMLCAVALPLLGVGDRGHIDGSATEARGLIAGIEQRCRGPIVW
jgi:hypothetical protein